MTKKILVVDDDRNIGQILHASLSAKGYETIISRNGEDALSQFRESEPDLVLLDVLLPKMNGWDVCKKIKAEELGQKTPVILMSAVYKNFKMQHDAKVKYGADDFIEKPFQLSQLLSTVTSHIGEGDGEAETELDVELDGEEPTEPQAEKPEAELTRMSGDLTISFPELLHDVYVMGKSGILTMQRDGVKKEISINQGYPVSVATNIEKEYFGNFLVRMRKITKDQCAESLDRMKQSNRLQGTILIEMGAITPQDLVHYLKLQMREKIFEIFSWRLGNFEFAEDPTVTGDISAIDMSTANVIFYGVKAHFDLDYALDRLEPYFERYLRLGSNQYYRFQDLELTPSENKFLLDIDGTQTVDELVASSPLEPLQTYHLLLTLVYSGMCETTREKAVEPDRFSQVMEGEGGSEEETNVFDAVDQEPVFDTPLGSEPGSEPVAEPEPEPEPEPETKSEAGEVDEKAAVRKKVQGKFESIQDGTFFHVLGVGLNPTEHEVRVAYHKLAKEYHPDRFFGNVSGEVKQMVDEIFGSVSQAYDRLNTQEKINEYAKSLEDQQPDAEKNEARLKGVKKVILAEQHFQNALNFLKEKRFTRASDAFRKAIDIAPNEAEYVAHYGWALYNMPFEKDLDEEELEMRGQDANADFQFQGREHLNKAIQISPRTEKAYLFLGQIYKGQGLKEFAEKQFEKALICNPNSIEALRELRLIKLEEQKSTKKKGLLERLLGR
jgi:DNA-binding response OmpR family regulator/curved DNA-binding protein CbpA